MRIHSSNLGSGWEGYALPRFDIAQVRRETAKNPVWLHFGAGNIFRVFPALMQQHLLDAGKANCGIIVCEAFDEELIGRVFEPYDNLSIAVTLRADGEMDKSVVASVTESLAASDSRDRLTAIFTADSLQMVSFTITEKGYAVYDFNGAVLPYIKRDMDTGPDGAASLMGILAALCYKRFLAGNKPLALVSMDNCSHNGDKLRAAVSAIAESWRLAGYVEAGFISYISDPALLSFPISMIDKITPRPSEAVGKILAADGLEDIDIVLTAKNSYAACFVNAEEAGYLVIEEVFPNGRPTLEYAGAIFTDRETVDRVEKMKVCTCLNPLHTALAVFGCLLGYDSIAAEMKDPQLSDLVTRIAFREGLPVVTDPGIIDPKDFIGEVLGKRFPNPFVPDTPQRIACDTSQKIPVRFGETLKAYIAAGKDVSGLTYIPLFFAGYCRYLMAVDDNGQPFQPSPDPMLAELMPHVAHLRLDGGADCSSLRPILSNASIFSVDLYEYGLGDKVEGYFREMTAGTGAIRATLEKYL